MISYEWEAIGGGGGGGNAVAPFFSFSRCSQVNNNVSLLR